MTSPSSGQAATPLHSTHARVCTGAVCTGQGASWPTGTPQAIRSLRGASAKLILFSMLWILRAKSSCCIAELSSREYINSVLYRI